MAVPAVEVEIGEQEHDQGCGEGNFGGRTPHLLVSGCDFYDLGEKAEIDADEGQHRPGQSSRCREHGGSLHDEQDGEEQGKESRDTDDYAAIERVGVDGVLVGVGFPDRKSTRLNSSHVKISYAV